MKYAFFLFGIWAFCAFAGCSSQSCRDEKNGKIVSCLKDRPDHLYRFDQE